MKVILTIVSFNRTYEELKEGFDVGSYKGEACF